MFKDVELVLAARRIDIASLGAGSGGSLRYDHLRKGTHDSYHSQGP
jgi:hypothetical protein